MFELNWKFEAEATCPHCGYSDDYTVYLNVSTIICNKCEKEFDVSLYVSDLELRAE